MTPRDPSLADAPAAVPSGPGADSVSVLLNGARQSVPAGSSVADLVRHLGLVAEQVAVERNHTLVRRAEHARTRLEAGDVLELVTLVGGG